MKIATYVVNDVETPGFVRADGQLVSFASAFAAVGVTAPVSALAAIEADDIAVLQQAFEAADGLESVDTETVTWAPPITRPSKIVGVAGNNSLLKKSAKKMPSHPIYFVSPPSALLGHLGSVRMRPSYGLTHPEGELAIVIGRRCSEEPPDMVMSAVFGYTVINDISSADLESDDTIVFSAAGSAAFSKPGADAPTDDFVFTYQGRAKGSDTFKPCGPWIVTADEIPDPAVLEVKVWMGDELCAEDTVGNLQYGVAEVLSDVSHYMTLEAGDIVHIGTAAAGKYTLRELDYQTWDETCTIEIPGIGRLTNPVARDQRLT